MSLTFIDAIECCSDVDRVREQYTKMGIYMASSTYLTNAHWKCLGPFFNFLHQDGTSAVSCMVVGKVSRFGSFLAPYGDFDIDESLATQMRNAKFRFALVSPDDYHGRDFQSDFATCISTIHSIVYHFRGIKSSIPFIFDGPEGPSMKFSHGVFEYMVQPTRLTCTAAKRLGFTGEYLTIARSLSPRSEPRRLPVYKECITHTAYAHAIKATDIPSMMVASLVSVKFSLTYSNADGLVPLIKEILVIKL